jgi:hypothetical protein
MDSHSDLSAQRSRDDLWPNSGGLVAVAFHCARRHGCQFFSLSLHWLRMTSSFCFAAVELSAHLYVLLVLFFVGGHRAEKCENASGKSAMQAAKISTPLHHLALLLVDSFAFGLNSFHWQYPPVFRSPEFPTPVIASQHSSDPFFLIICLTRQNLPRF